VTWRAPAAALAVGGMLVAAGVGPYAQSRVGRPQLPQTQGNVEYDGRPTFVRLRYSSGFSGFGGFGRRGGGREAGWAHDYPTADLNLMQIVRELTLADARVDGSNIFALDDPELFRHPIAYMSEPGYWVPSESEANGLRNYLLKGGFIIFDDFRGADWYNLEEQMRRVLPDHRFIQLDVLSPVFHSFFDLQSLDVIEHPYGAAPATYFGLFEDNDPRGRLMAIANRDGDLGEYWEYSATGFFAVDLSNEAYKFGVNYIIYGLTH
jgi:hypothetical protein